MGKSENVDSVIPAGDGHGDAIGGETHVSRLWVTAKLLTDDIADQALIVAYAVRAGWSDVALRQRAALHVPYVPGAIERVLTHRRKNPDRRIPKGV